jgi:AmpE protein
MTFLALIVALIFIQLYGEKNPVHNDNWFVSAQRRSRGFGFNPTVSLVIYIVVPVVVVRFILSVVDSWLFGLLWIGGATLILLYSFGREHFDSLAQRYRNYCMSGDFEAAYLYAQEELDIDPETLNVDSPEETHEAIQTQLLYLGYQRWFAVLFYFVLLGPLASLAYRLLQLSRPTPEGELAAKILFYIDWIPTRLLASGFALTGNFLSSRDRLMASLSEARQASGSVLLSVGRAAIGGANADGAQDQQPFFETAAIEAGELRDLMSRSAGAWLIAISLIVLFF